MQTPPMSQMLEASSHDKEVRTRENDRLTVYIFGAGASTSAGYPTAAVFSAELEQFNSRLAGEPDRKVEKLIKTIQSTLEHLKQTGAKTIDELVGSLNDSQAIEDAKTATEALFLDMELRLTPKKLRDYSNFLVRACMSGKGKVEDQLREDVRVLTFNYDRTLEIAFALLAEKIGINSQSLNREIHKLGINDIRSFYDNLNTGFQSGEGYDLKINCFAYLKLHGSIGLRLPENDPNIKHQQPFPVGTVLNDELLWKKDGGLKVPSLIVFPHEKAKLSNENIGSLPTFHDYISKIESDAIEVIQAAKEVHICGYSVCQPKWTRFEEIVKRAKSDCVFVIHDKSPLPLSRLNPIVFSRGVFHVKEDFSEAW